MELILTSESGASDVPTVIDAEEYADAIANPDPAWAALCKEADTYVEEHGMRK